MSDRKLATIRQIAEIKEHTNADTLEIAIVDGWQVVVRKGEFNAGDLVVYFEVDSVLPVLPEYEFLRKCCYVKRDWIEGFRLKTIRLRGEKSQGLIVPVEHGAVDWIKNIRGLYDSVLLGDDVTDNLGVVKWDPPVAAHLSGQVKGTFPRFIPKTDQERVQNLVRELKTASDNQDVYEVTLKLDGSSCTLYWCDGEAGVCSRNQELKINDENSGNSFVKVMVESGLLDAFNEKKINIAFQGELMGPGIQGNRENFIEHRFYIFDIFDIDEQRYLNPTERLEWDFSEFKNVYHVPSLGFEIPMPTVNEMLAYAEGPSINNPVREGLVWKRFDGEFSFKTISDTYLENEK